jgi:hypothetical protein
LPEEFVWYGSEGVLSQWLPFLWFKFYLELKLMVTMCHGTAGTGLGFGFWQNDNVAPTAR